MSIYRVTFQCSVAGIPFCLDTPDVYAWFGQNAPLWSWAQFSPPPSYPDSGLIALGQPRLPLPPMPDLGCLSYPTGASRWASFMGVMTSDQVDVLLPLAYTSGGVAQALSFKMQQGLVTISTNLYLLPPKPLVKMKGFAGLFLVCLVDDRYFWQWKDCGNITLTTSTSWDTYIGELATALGISLSTSTSSTYGQPHPFSDLSNPYQSAAEALDQAMAATGCTLVRALAGTYSAMSVAASNTQIATNKAVCGDVIGGWDISTDTYDKNYQSLNAMGAILPSQVTVVFDKYVPSTGIYQAQTSHLPFSRNTGSKYAVTTPVSSLTYGGKTYTGFSGSQTVRTTAEAYFANIGNSTPDNAGQVNALAAQIAQDYYDNQFHGADYIFPSIANWQPEGIYDVEWYYKNSACLTRIKRKPYQFAFGEMTHHFTSTGFVSGGIGAITSIVSDGSLTITNSGSTDTIIINEAHTNTWTVEQDFLSGGYGVKLLPGSLSGSSTTSNWLNIVGTIPTSNSAATYGLNAQITSAGSSSQIQGAGLISLLAGYTGSSATYGLQISNAAAGTNSPSTPFTTGGNACIEAVASGVTASGQNYGLTGKASGSSIANVGVRGFATGVKPQNIGVLGGGTQATTSNIGVLGTLNTGGLTTTITTSAALMGISLGGGNSLALLYTQTNPVWLVDGTGTFSITPIASTTGAGTTCLMRGQDALASSGANGGNLDFRPGALDTGGTDGLFRILNGTSGSATFIVTNGSVTTGTWTGTKIGLAYGGTNADLSSTGGTGQYLKQSSSGAAITVGTIAAADLPGSFSGFANPTSPGVNLSGSNGSATTAMRSDAILVLDQAIAPTWTGQHIHTVTSGTSLLNVATFTLNSGYTGSTATYGLHVIDAAAGTNQPSSGTLGGNTGVQGDSTATTTGYNRGITGKASGSSVLNEGCVGNTPSSSSGVSIGTRGTVTNLSGAAGYAGVFASLGTSSPASLTTAAALVVVSGGGSNQLASFQTSLNTEVASITSTGLITSTVGLNVNSGNFVVNAGGDTVYTVARTITSASGAALDDVKVAASTTTLTGTTTVTKLGKVSLYQPTITDSSSVTVTDAATLYIDNAPTAGGSVTLTHAWAILVNAGNVKFAGTANSVGTITSGTWNGTTIAIANGGSGQTTANNALNAFLPSQSSNSGKFLTTDGTNTSWASAGGGGGTLAVSGGGTGATSFTAYSVICAGTTSTGAFQNVSGIGFDRQFLMSSGSGLPSWSNYTSYGHGADSSLEDSVEFRWFQTNYYRNGSQNVRISEFSATDEIMMIMGGDNSAMGIASASMSIYCLWDASNSVPGTNEEFVQVTVGSGDGSVSVTSIGSFFTQLEFHSLSGYSLTDPGSNYNASTDIYTCPVDGIYMIVTAMRLTDGAI